MNRNKKFVDMKIVIGIIYFLASVLIPIVMIFAIFKTGAKTISPKSGDPTPYFTLMGVVILVSTFFTSVFYYILKGNKPTEANGFLGGFIFWFFIDLFVLFA